jgi:hypothetical protein
MPTSPAAYPVSSTVTVTTDSGLANMDHDDNGIQNPVSGTLVGAPVRSPEITLTWHGETTSDGDGDNGDLTFDFGFFHPLQLGDTIWNDLNGDGLQDTGEPGLAGATVQLFQSDGLTPATDIDGHSVASQTTAANDQYLFTNLAPGDYVAQVTPPAGHVHTLGGANPNNDNNADSNGVGPLVSGATVVSLPVTLTSGGEPDTAMDGDDISHRGYCALFFCVPDLHEVAVQAVGLQIT